MTFIEVPALILLLILLFIIIGIIAAIFAYKAYRSYLDNVAEDIAEEPEDVKEHAREGLKEEPDQPK